MAYYFMKYRGIPIQEITIRSHILLYLGLCLQVLKAACIWAKKIFVDRILLVLALIIVWLLVTNVTLLRPIYSFALFALYWIVLGVASSIGLGTGLHTFVLYLGPHIAKVAMVATTCGHLPEMLPSKWQFDHFGPCNPSDSSIGFLGILLAVQIQSFFWGFGTALGELPPYYVAKKASETRAELKRIKTASEHKKQDEEENLIKGDKQVEQTNAEIDEILELKTKRNRTLMDSAKIIIYDNLEKYGFLTILACASIPNPLFDLAGITCGHFRIPFRIFFTATFIGKAIIKVHLQMVFVIIIFRKQTVDGLLNILRSLSEGMVTAIEASLEAQRKVLHEPKTFSQNKPLLAKLWDLFLIAMIGYFVISILNGLVQEKAIELRDSEKHQQKHEKK